LFKNRLLIIYRQRDRLSEASMRYLKWFYNVIYRIPVDVVDSLSFIEASNNPPLVTSDSYNYIIIFLLSPISGESEDHKLWERLLKVEQKVPIVTFYRTAYTFNGESVYKMIFNIDPICEREACIRDVSFTDETLRQGIDYPCAKDLVSDYNSVNDKDQFVVVRPFRKDKDFKPLMLLKKNDIVASQSGLNIFIGQKGVAIPREDLALELDRPIYFLKLLDNLLKKSPAGYLRLRPTMWPVVLRMDDPPMTWQFMSRRAKILTPSDYVRILNTLTKYGAKMTCFVTSAIISRDGKIRSWIETDCDDAKKILRILEDGVRKGVFEIGCHGLTHLTIGYKTPSTITKIIWNVKSIKINLAREFYDSLSRKEIPYDLQKKQLERSIELIEKLFGSKPKAFAPPAHVWGDSTEKAVLEMGMPFLSADMNFYLYPEGFDFRKNPSPIGESAQNGKLLYVSATVLGNYGTFKKTFKLFNELGVPLVWQQHNFYPSWFTSEILESFFKDLTPFNNKIFMTIGELGDLLQKWRKIKIDTNLDNGYINCEIEAEIPVLVEAYYRGKIQVKEVSAGRHQIEMNFQSP
jgi:peptidoglycan/xylan/chitin deacetylase (PgdA/CDA1 family)